MNYNKVYLAALLIAKLNLVPNGHTLFWPEMVGFCDLVGTPYVPVSKIVSVKDSNLQWPFSKNFQKKLETW